MLLSFIRSVNPMDTRKKVGNLDIPYSNSVFPSQWNDCPHNKRHICPALALTTTIVVGEPLSIDSFSIRKLRKLDSLGRLVATEIKDLLTFTMISLLSSKPQSADDVDRK